MKISNDESLRAGRISPVVPAPSGVAKAAPVALPGQGPAAQVEVSEQARALAATKTEAARFLPAVQAAPETRDDLVSRLKSQVDAGTYHVSGADIAGQILRRAQADRIR